MSIAQPLDALKQRLDEILGPLQGLVEDAAQQGQPVHQVERTIWTQVLALGRSFLGYFLALLGDGDRGETIHTEAGEHWQRLDEPHRRRYLSIFGPFELLRVVYGSREGQKIAFVPLDNRLQLPAGVYSYVLQDWAQGLCVEAAFGQGQTTLERLLGLNLSVDALERMNAQMAQHVEDYRVGRPAPPAETEGELVVATADGKGIVMRRCADDPAPPAHRTKGDKASQKQMATVASVYTVDRHVRAAEEVGAALFRDPRGGPPPPRPVPQNKHVWASLTRHDADGEASSIAVVHEAILNEVIERNRRDQHWVRPLVCLYDGQEALWEARRRQLPPSAVEVLDFLHVTPRLWKAAHLFHKEKSAAAEQFVRERCLRVLQGRVEGVIRGLREMGTKHGLKGARKKSLAQLCAYLEKNRGRMRYDEYLAAGYPIASGVIEGACRHLVKDRMERAGMHWTPEGAQAMLDVRSAYVDGEWDSYQAYRIRRETQKLYPHRHLVEGTNYAMAC
jgi:hypothetical protein